MSPTPSRPSACQQSAGRPMTYCSGHLGTRRSGYFRETDAKSIAPNAVIFTPVTLSDQPMVAVEYHIGMAGMLSARRATASWYFLLAAAGSVAAAASTSALSKAVLL